MRQEGSKKEKLFERSVCIRLNQEARYIWVQRLFLNISINVLVFLKIKLSLDILN